MPTGLMNGFPLRSSYFNLNSSKFIFQFWQTYGVRWIADGMGFEVRLKNQQFSLDWGKGWGIVPTEALCKSFQISQKKKQPINNPKQTNPPSPDLYWVSNELQNQHAALYCQYSQYWTPLSWSECEFVFIMFLWLYMV